jgi:diguanylate cyclase (GGDEF)-like protein
MPKPVVSSLTPGAEGKTRRATSLSTWVRTAAWCILVVGISGSLVGAVVWKGFVDREASSSRRGRATTAEAVVATRLALDNNLMAQLRGLVLSSPDITNAQFIRWWNAAEITKRFPGRVGFAFVQRVPASQLADFAAARESDPINGVPAVHPYQVFPAGPADDYCLQRVGLSETTEVKGFQIPAGLDFCAPELQPPAPSPLPALLAEATDLGVPTVITPDQLLPGVFALLLPVYRNGTTPQTIEGRRLESLGWVVGSFESAALTASAGGGVPGLTIEVSHAGADGSESSISTDGDPSELSDPTTSTATIADGWTISVRDDINLGGPSADQQVAALFLTGLTLSLLAFVFVRLLGGSRERALDLVAERTAELAYQAMHDSLTGLPNRALILDRATGALNRAQREDIPVAAFFIDLDDFKSINDTLGHAAGDELLKSVASRFTGALRVSDTVGRIGGDEFVVLAEGPSLLAGPEVVADRILDVLGAPFELAGEPRQIGASIGVASGPRATADDWLRDADIALYEAKAAGKRRYVVFESEMQQALQDRVTIERDLREGLASEQFFLLYQPAFDLRTNQATGVEALIRWQHPIHGVVAPDDFIPGAERTGLIGPIGRWVLQQACRQGAVWSRQGRRMTMSVNLSPRQLESDELIDDVRSALIDSAFEPSDLVLELTETTLMRDAPATHRRLGALKELGVRLAVDDFGTGYSSLAYLSQFPIDVLKIDRSFISGIDETSEATIMIRTLVQLGKALGLETLAEGIESEAQLTRLVREQCDSGQGFLFAHPLRPRALEELLEIPSAPAQSLASPVDHTNLHSPST